MPFWHQTLTFIRGKRWKVLYNIDRYAAPGDNLSSLVICKTMPCVNEITIILIRIQWLAASGWASSGTWASWGRPDAINKHYFLSAESKFKKYLNTLHYYKLFIHPLKILHMVPIFHTTASTSSRSDAFRASCVDCFAWRARSESHPTWHGLKSLILKFCRHQTISIWKLSTQWFFGW